MRVTKPLSVFLSLFSLIFFSAIPTFAQSNSGNSYIHSHAPRIKNKNGTSLNWSGYAVETNLANPQNHAVSDVKGSWIVPTLDCTKTPNTYSAQWVGIDGYSDNTVEQTGTEADCSGIQQVNYPWLEMYPRNSATIPHTVSAGDTMSADVHYVGRGFFKLTLSDATHWTYTTTQKLGSAKRESAEWIVEAPWAGGILPLADFGTQAFTGTQATIGTHTGSLYYFNNPLTTDAITMENQSGSTKAYPFGLQSDGSFDVQFVSSN